MSGTLHDATASRPISKILIAMPGAENVRDALSGAFENVTVELADGDAVVSAIVDADAVICWRLPEEALAAATRLKWVHIAAAGIEQILRVPGFRERDLILTNSSGISAPNMAEHAMALMLAFARRLPWLQRSQERRKWREWEAGLDSFELGGQTVVLAGLGAIGLATAERAKAFGMHVIGVRRSTDGDVPPYVDEVVATADIDAALARADHVVNSLPATPATLGLFDAGRFATMKKSAYFYNLGRGTTVVQTDLISALEAGAIAGAGLDVTDPEPLLEDSPLWGFDNVIVTSHTSGNSPRVRERMIALAEENVRRYMSGEELLNVVNQGEGY